MKKFLFVLLVFLSTISIIGCNPFGNDDDDGNYVGPTAVNAPVNAAAFNGVKMSFNPTITFASDGTTNTFTYVNNAEDTGISKFPDAGGATLSGTYTYTQDATDKTIGTLNFIFADAAKNFSLIMKNFTGYANGITGLEITKVGDSSSTAFQVRIVEGALVPEPAATSTGTGTSTDTGAGTDVTIPDSLKGQIMDLTYGRFGNSVPGGFPYNDGDKVKFTFSSSSILAIGESYRSVGTPKKYSGSEEIVWYDSEYNIYYALSFKQDGSFNEINVYSNPATTPVSFYGQFGMAQ